MKIKCQECKKVYNIPDDRLPSGKKVSFPCPSCKGKILIDLSKKESERETQRVIYSPKPSEPAQDESGEDIKKQILKTLDDLPPMPKIVTKAREIMADPKSSFKDMAKVIETDQAIAARVLKMANSAYYGLSGTVSSIHQATVVLGYETLDELITMVSASTLLGNKLKGYGLNAGTLWRHSLAVAFGARIIAQKRMPPLENDAFSIGLIHDAGKLALDKYLVKHLKQFESLMASNQTTYLTAEKQILGLDHTEIALELCNKWNLPPQHASAIRFHHNPSKAKDKQLAYFVHLANYISMKEGIFEIKDAHLYSLDESTLEFLGFEESDVEEIATEVLESVEKISQSI